MDPITLVLAALGVAAGFGANIVVTKKKLGSAQDQADKELAKAKREANKFLDEAREETAKILDEGRKEEQARRRELKEIEQRLVSREETFTKKLDELDKRTDRLRTAEGEVEELKDEIRDIRKRQQEKLEKIAKLSREDAASKLMQMTERDIKNDLTGLVSKLQNEAKDNAEEKAGLIIVSAMERMASEVTAERRFRQARGRRNERPHYR
jgi:ribonuclease Y